MSDSTATAENKGKETPPPRILRPWAYLYRTIPKVYLPFTDLDVSFTLASAAVLTCVRIVIMQLLLAAGWPVNSKMTTDAAGSLTSVTHSLLLVPGVGACLFFSSVPYVPSARLTEAKLLWYQDAVNALLSLCTGYMLFDSIFLYIDSVTLGHPWTDFEWLVFGHHVATVLYMTSCRLVKAGHISTMILIFTGECTNPLMNSMFTTRFAITLFSAPWVHTLHTCLEFVYALFYAPIRIIVGPVCAIHLTYDLLLTKHGRQNVPVQLSVVWVALCWIVIAGSVPWMLEALDMIRDGLAVKFHDDYDYGDRYRVEGSEL
jgi:hypothetical protein